MNSVTVPVFQLIQWKHALKLEEKGLKHSQGSVRMHIIKLLGLPKRTKAGDLSKMCADILEQAAQQGVTLQGRIKIDLEN